MSTNPPSARCWLGLFKFTGRSGRTEFTLVMALNILGALAMQVALPSGFSLVSVACALAALSPIVWMGLATTTRRLNDLEMSRWWVALSFVPVVSLLMALPLVLKAGTGPKPSKQSSSPPPPWRK